MKSTKVGGSRIVVFAIVLSVSAAAYADAQGSASGEGGAVERTAAEVEVARTGVVSRLRDALGSAFGGVWFEPSTARLHVGVTSVASRRSAEAVAAQAGVTEIVTETSVDSSWAQLEAAQDRWADRLADLFERAEVTTSLRAQYNALEVELGASVPVQRRAELQGAAAADGVDVLIAPSPREHFRIADQARCNAFTPNKAYCDPTIVAGVTIQHEEEAAEPCTAGPAVIPTDGSTPAKATERLLLTAGHCIATGKGKWFSYDKAAKGKLEIGPAGSFLSGHVADIGVIGINNPGKWAQAGFIPVVPTIAPWNEAAPEPFPVVAEQEPVEEYETCISGQTSGKLCGKILKTHQTFVNKSDLAEVNVTTQGGDSGAPWYSKSYAESSAGLVEGVHVGLNGSNAVFQPLNSGLAALKKEKGLDLELLTQNNEERRHPKAITASKYPATASGKGSSAVFTAFGTSVKCSESEFDGVLSGEAKSIELTPVYVNCTAISGLPATVTNNGCKYKLTLSEKVAEGQYKATMDIVCPEGKAGIEMHIYASKEAHSSGVALCRLTVPPQTGLKTVTLTNSGGSIVVDKGAIEGIKVKMHRISILCPSGPGTEKETTTGVYDLESSVTLAGTNEGKAVEIDMAGG